MKIMKSKIKNFQNFCARLRFPPIASRDPFKSHLWTIAVTRNSGKSFTTTGEVRERDNFHFEPESSFCLGVWDVLRVPIHRIHYFVRLEQWGIVGLSQACAKH